MLVSRLLERCRLALTTLGIPTLAPSFLPEHVKVWVQSENGILGMVSAVFPLRMKMANAGLGPVPD